MIDVKKIISEALEAGFSQAGELNARHLSLCQKCAICAPQTVAIITPQTGHAHPDVEALKMRQKGHPYTLPALSSRQ